MNKILLVVAGLALAGIALAAQEPPALTEAQEDQKAAEEALAKLDARLHFTPGQKAKALPILAGRQRRLKALAATPGGRPLAKARQARTIVEESDRQLMDLLDPDQQTSYQALVAERQQRAKERLRTRPS